MVYIQGTAPYFVSLDLVELPHQKAETIVRFLLDCLKSHGFDHQCLSEHLVAFASDGTTVMLGPKSGVAQRLSNLLSKHLDLAPSKSLA